jgi:RNA polymerase sigma-70 factor (ECF subfamily)
MTQRDQPTSNGPPQAIDWGNCLAEHERWIRAVILARTGEPEAVDEVWQEVSLAAIEQRAPLGDREKAPAWLHRLAVIRSIRYRRQCARQRKRLARFAAESNGHAPADDDPFQWLLGKERQELVRRALGQIAGRDAEILMLKYRERWSYRRIAALLEISESAVDARVFRARERLRKQLAHYFSERTD